MLELNLKSGVPICDQIVNGFIRLKALGLAESGEQLPSVRQLAVKLSVNPNTIQKAYQMLESSGVIYSVKGKGSFFSDDPAADIAVIKAAKRDFRSAAVSAKELGLKKEELIDIINDVCKEGNSEND
ncbi:MAG: GntR family transcriptional regulator [Acutalibacteraceae bacterium]|nr:GntR family transcriptional regulator [Clostridia bacterium]MEE1330627.1 GntR family transcriptional regulator [Acutalibacteraceae bacterium]